MGYRFWATLLLIGVAVAITISLQPETVSARWRTLVADSLALYGSYAAQTAEQQSPEAAAKIFDRLELKILVEVASLINPRRMSDILAQMQPDAAQQLTVELAARSNSKEKSAELPKIEGKPMN